jgi:hypothetical protein
LHDHQHGGRPPHHAVQPEGAVLVSRPKHVSHANRVQAFLYPVFLSRFFRRGARRRALAGSCAGSRQSWQPDKAAYRRGHPLQCLPHFLNFLQHLSLRLRRQMTTATTPWGESCRQPISNRKWFQIPCARAAGCPYRAARPDRSHTATGRCCPPSPRPSPKASQRRKGRTGLRCRPHHSRPSPTNAGHTVDANPHIRTVQNNGVGVDACTGVASIGQFRHPQQPGCHPVG